MDKKHCRNHVFVTLKLSQGEDFGVKSTSSKLGEKVELSCLSPSPCFFLWGRDQEGTGCVHSGQRLERGRKPGTKGRKLKVQ